MLKLIFPIIFLFQFSFYSQTIEEAFDLKSQLKYDLSIIAFEKTSDINKHLYIAQVYDLQEVYNKAIQEIYKHLDIHKNDLSARIYLGQLFFKAKQFNLLISNYENLNEGEHNDNTLYTLGLAYQETRNLPQAIVYYKKALTYNPNHRKTIYKMGVYHAQTKEYAKSIEFINQGLKLSPINVDFLALKAQVDFYTDNWKSCISTVMLLNHSGYKTENQHFMMAKSYSKINQYNNAIEYLKIIIDEYETTNPSVYFHLGMNYGYNKQFDLAEKSLLKAIEMNKNSFENEYYYLGEFSKETNKRKALNYYKKALNEKSDMFYAHYQILLIELENKDNKTQLKLIENFTNKHKNMPKEYSDYFVDKIKYLKKEIHLE